MVEVFITNIESVIDNRSVMRKLKEIFPELKIDFDIAHERINSFPCQHNILRAEGQDINAIYIIEFVKKLGFDCQILEDKICA